MPYSYTGNTKQLGVAHENVVCAIKVDPTSGIPAEHLGHATADAAGNFVITWDEWAGRVAICAFDDDETAKLQCKVLDWNVGVPTNDRYSGFLGLDPAFFYELSETGTTWANRVDAAATLTLESGFTAPLLTRQFLPEYVGMPGMVLDQDCLLTEQTLDATDAYNFAGEMTVACVFKTGNDIVTLQAIAGFANQGDATEAGNAQWMFGIEDSKVVFKHQFGELGTWANHICTTTLEQNELYFLVISRDATASNEVRFHLQGVFVNAVTQPSSSRPTGGTTAKFAVGGMLGTAANCFDGTLISLYGSEQVLNDVQASRIARAAENWYYSILLGYSELFFFWPMRETTGSISANYSDSTDTLRRGVHNRTIAGIYHAQPGGLQGFATTFRANGTGTRYVKAQRTIYPAEAGITVGAWFRTVTPEYAWQFLFAHYRSTSDNFVLQLNNLTLVQRLNVESRGTANQILDGVSVVFDVWEFICMVVDPYTGDIDIYRNGELTWSFVVAPPVNPDEYYNFCVGSWSTGGGSYYRGYACGVFYMEKKLSAQAQVELYQASFYTGRDVEIAAALVSQWTMDDIVGTTINDELSANDGTINGTVPVVTDGRFGDAIELSGVATDYVDLGAIMSTGWAEMTITLWFRQAPGATAGYMLAKYDAENNARCFYIHYDGADKYSFGVMSDPAVENAAQVASTYIGAITAQFDDGFWHCMVCRFQENVEIGIRMDASRETFAATPSTMADTAEPTLIGKCGSVAPGASAFDIDDLRIFDSYLSTDEVHQVLSGHQ